MKGITATITLAARECRKRGQGSWPLPSHKLDELAEYLQRVDRLVIAVESFAACAQSDPEGTYWSEDETEGLGYLRRALDEVRP